MVGPVRRQAHSPLHEKRTRAKTAGRACTLADRISVSPPLSRSLWLGGARLPEPSGPVD